MLRSALRLLWVPLALLAGAAAAAEMDFQITGDTGDGYRAAVTIENPGDRPVSDWSLEFNFDRDVVQSFGADVKRLAADRYRFTPSEWTKVIAPGGQAKFTFVGKPGDIKVGPQQVKLDVTFAAAVAAAPPPAPQPAQPPAAQPQPAPPKPAAPAAPRPTPETPTAEKPAAEKPAGAQVANATRPAAGAGVPHLTAFKLKNSWGNGFVGEMVVINNSNRAISPWRLEMTLDTPIDQMWEADYKQTGPNRWTVTPKDHNAELAPGGFVVFGFKGAAAFQARPSDTRLSEGG